MVVLVVIVLIVVAVVVLVATSRSKQRREYEQRTAANPIDPLLDEVFFRPGDTSWKIQQAAEDALREATPHIRRMTTECGEAPMLIVHTDFSDERRHPAGLLVVTTAQTLRFSGGRMQSVSHRAGTTTGISAGNDSMRARVEVQGSDGSLGFTADDLAQAQLICGAIDNWAENPEVRYDPRIIVTPKRVHIPDEFFADVLRAAGYPVTSVNMQSIHERFGMMFTTTARKRIDQKHGLAAGERFTEDFGRPTDDAALPTWAVHSLSGWLEVEPKIGYTSGPFLPHQTRTILLDSARTGGYLAHPERSLGMWKSEWYDNDGRGARREIGPGQPPVSA